MAKKKEEQNELEKANKPVKKENTPDIDSFEEMIENAPPEIKNVLSRFFSMSISHQESSALPSKFLDAIGEKVTDSHITEIISNADKSDSRGFLHSLITKVSFFFLILCGLGVFIWITLFLAKDDKESYFEILKMLAIFGGGFGIGYGYKSYKSK